MSNLIAFDEQVEKATMTFKLAYDHCHKLIASFAKHPWHKDDGITALIGNLQKEFPLYAISLTESFDNPEDIDQAPKQFIVFKLLNKEWRVKLEFFTSVEAQQLIEMFKAVADVANTQWTITMLGKDRTISGQGVLQLITGIAAVSKPYMNIQRYKGLGEMNPEQLWETAMDASSRALLKVSIEDGLEADNWFTTLMGEDVAGRKHYIEEFGHFVRNLDV